jgi:hypothetical protein
MPAICHDQPKHHQYTDSEEGLILHAILSEWRTDSSFKQKYPSVQVHSRSNMWYRNIS